MLQCLKLVQCSDKSRNTLSNWDVAIEPNFDRAGGRVGLLCLAQSFQEHLFVMWESFTVCSA